MLLPSRLLTSCLVLGTLFFQSCQKPGPSNASSEITAASSGKFRGISLIPARPPKVAPQKLGQLFDLPPAFVRLAGDPTVHFTRKPGVTIFKTTFNAGVIPLIAAQADRWSSIECSYPGIIGKSQRNSLLATAVMRRFYKDYASDEVSNGLVLGRMNSLRFIRTGALRLQRKPVADRVANAWWNVRMDVAAEREPAAYRSGYVIFITDNIGPFDAFGIGHNSICLRRIGGNPDFDLVLDPRAPTYPDYKTTFTNIIFGDSRLINGLRVYSLWDWMEVQTLDRFVDVNARILGITKSQVILLKDYARNDLRYTTGTFHFLGNNCARLARELFDAILPIDRHLARSSSLVVMPADVVAKTSARFPLLAEFVFQGKTPPEDMMITPNMEMRRLKSRRKSPQFLKYLKFETERAQIFAPFRRTTTP